MSLPAVQIRHLSKTFTLHNRGGTPLRVLQDFNLDVFPGECIALHGPSGAGKSTVLKCIYANYLANSGSVEVRHDDQSVDMTRAPVHQLLEVRRRTLGYVSQFLRVIPRVPTIDIVAEALIDLAGDDEASQQTARSKAQELLQRLRIPQRLWDLPPSTFSGGEQQRVNIARSFVQVKPVMLLDEPTASLDVDNRQTVIAMIREATNRGAAIVGIFHDREVRDAVATRVAHLAEAP